MSTKYPTQRDKVEAQCGHTKDYVFRNEHGVPVCPFCLDKDIRPGDVE